MGKVVALRNPGIDKMNETFRQHWEEVSMLMDEDNLDHWLVVANNFHLAIEMMCRVAEEEDRPEGDLRSFIKAVVDSHFDNA